MLRQLILTALIGTGAACASCTPKLRVEHFLNSAPSLDMVSSLVIGSEAAIIIDLPLAVPQAVALADWVANTTDKPLVAAFATHFHPDHYLSGAAFLAKFPAANFYANSKAVSLIKNDAEERVRQLHQLSEREQLVSNKTRSNRSRSGRQSSVMTPSSITLPFLFLMTSHSLLSLATNLHPFTYSVLLLGTQLMKRFSGSPQSPR